jgi:hypothetical protein
VDGPAGAADRLKQAVDDDAWDDFIWALIASDDMPAAYWVAQSLEAQGKRPVAPSWLIAAAQGARWLDTGSELESSLRAIADQHTPGDNGKMRMLALAASLRPVLLAPQAVTWAGSTPAVRLPRRLAYRRLSALCGITRSTAAWRCVLRTSTEQRVSRNENERLRLRLGRLRHSSTAPPI